MGAPPGVEDLAKNSKADHLYASSIHMDSVLVFDLKGTRIGSFTPKPPDKLYGPLHWLWLIENSTPQSMTADRVSEIDL